VSSTDGWTLVPRQVRIVENGVRIEFRLEAGQEPTSVSNVDAVIEMPDGTRWGATLITIDEIEQILSRHRVSGESRGGLYLHGPDLIIMAEPGIDRMAEALADVVRNRQHVNVTPLDLVEPRADSQDPGGN
jgi:hypothetical protein